MIKDNDVLKQDAQDAINSVRMQYYPKLKSVLLPGPTGESNQLSEFGRGVILCLGPTNSMVLRQSQPARDNGYAAITVAPQASGSGCVNGFLPREYLNTLEDFDAVVLWSDDEDLKQARKQLATRKRRLIP